MKEIKDLASMIRQHADNLVSLADKLERNDRWTRRKWVKNCDSFIDAFVGTDNMMSDFRRIRFKLFLQEKDND